MRCCFKGALKPFFLFEKQQASYNDKYADCDYNGISPHRVKLRHISEIHSIPACNQCQRHKDSRNDRKDRHNTVLFDIQMRVINVADLNGVLGDSNCRIAQPFYTVDKQSEITKVIVLEKVILILLKLL